MQKEPPVSHLTGNTPVVSKRIEILYKHNAVHLGRLLNHEPELIKVPQVNSLTGRMNVTLCCIIMRSGLTNDAGHPYNKYNQENT